MQIEVLYDKNLLSAKTASEDYTMNALNLLLNIRPDLIRKGNPDLYEPDYIINNEYGVEVTRAAQITKQNSIIGEIKKSTYKPLDFSADNEIGIRNAIEEKISKNYSCSNVKLAIQMVVPDFSVKFIPEDKNIEPFFQKQCFWINIDFLCKIYNKAIHSKKFSEVYIILPYLDKKLAIYCVKEMMEFANIKRNIERCQGDICLPYHIFQQKDDSIFTFKQI